MKYVIRWGSEWAYEILPIHKTVLHEGEQQYTSREIALNHVISEMSHAKRMLHDAIARAQKKQRAMDRRRDGWHGRSEAILGRHA